MTEKEILEITIINFKENRINLFKKLSNFSKAIIDQTLSGFPIATEEEKLARLTICETCDQKEENTCKKCGCRLDIKASWATSKCPLNKWPGDTPKPRTQENIGVTEEKEG